MNEQRVRAAVNRVTREAHGLFMGTGVECRMVPVDALQELVEAVDDVPADDEPDPEDVPA